MNGSCRSRDIVPSRKNSSSRKTPGTWPSCTTGAGRTGFCRRFLRFFSGMRSFASRRSIHILPACRRNSGCGCVPPPSTSFAVKRFSMRSPGGSSANFNPAGVAPSLRSEQCDGPARAQYPDRRRVPPFPRFARNGDCRTPSLHLPFRRHPAAGTRPRRIQLRYTASLFFRCGEEAGTFHARQSAGRAESRATLFLKME